MLERLLALWRANPLAWLCLCGGLAALPVQAQDAAALRERHGALQSALSANAFGRPLVLDSSEPPGRVQGDIYARIEQPFSEVGPALKAGAPWCEILMLHLNVQQCRADSAATGSALSVIAGSRYDQPLSDAYRFDFTYRVLASRTDYLHLSLNADQGPLGTSDYRIGLEVVSLDTARSFIHLSYGYGEGLAARVAMQTYLATIGRKKVGFTVVGRMPDGTADYIRGTRGVVERNTMRYFLAIEAYLGALALPPAQQLERRLVAWHAGIERYPTQLHELELAEYLSLKRNQLQRPLAGAGPLPAIASKLERQ
jgi:hypothetical protein